MSPSTVLHNERLQTVLNKEELGEYGSWEQCCELEGNSGMMAISGHGAEVGGGGTRCVRSVLLLHQGYPIWSEQSQRPLACGAVRLASGERLRCTDLTQLF